MRAFRSVLLATAGLALTWSTAAAAQTADATAPAGVTPTQDEGADTARDGLQDIIVTAQRRQQTLQDVPVSVGVVDSSLLETRHSSSIADIGQLVPNLSVTASPFQPFVAIRGLGSSPGTRAIEQSVATYVDGVYAGRANQFLNPFFDVERVEVVRGPQGVLFGVNAIAGAINIVNRKPGKELSGYMTGGYEVEYGGYNLEGGISIPLTSTLGVRFSGQARRDGPYLQNTVTGREEPDSRSQIGRAVLSWRPDGSTRFDLQYDHSHRNVRGSAFQTTSLPQPSPIPPALEDGRADFTKSSPGTPDFTRITADNASLNMSHDTGSVTLSSTTGYSTYQFRQTLPAAAVPIFIGSARASERFRQIYQEVRLESSGKNSFDYLIGGTYYHQKSDLYQSTDFDLTFFGAPGVGTSVQPSLLQRNNTFSAFAQGTINFNDSLNLVVGARYIIVKKRGDFFLTGAPFGSRLEDRGFDPVSAIIAGGVGRLIYIDPANPATIRPTSAIRERTDRALNPSVSLNWKPTSNLSTYLTYQTGTKGGGFNDQEAAGLIPENGFSIDTLEYNKEKAYNIEAGVKYAGRYVRANLTGFRTKYKDLQVSQSTDFNGFVALAVQNAASATAWGLESDITWAASSQLTLTADAAYLHARYDNYPGVGCIITPVPAPCDFASSNARGRPLDGVPTFTGSVNANYIIPLSDSWELRSLGRVYYNSGAQFGSLDDPLDRVPGYVFLDAALTLAETGKGLSVSVSGKNLTNKLARGLSTPAGLAVFGHQSVILPGRTIFLDLRYDF